MEQLSPQVMNKLVFAVLMHGLPDNQVNLALSVLTEASGNSNAQIRELAIVALSELPVVPTKRVSALALGLRDTTARVRRRAARAIGDQGPAAAAALTALAAGLRDTDASVRRDCAGSIGRIGAQAHTAAPGLVPMLADPETRTRAVVAVSLKRIGPGAIPAVLNGLKSASPEVRARCASLAGQIAPEDPRVQAALLLAAADKDPIVREYVDEAMLAATTPAPVGPNRILAATEAA
ncbi:MAG TPA: HEAT repeat domain-containing protein [Fimbriiglobus sp.]|jgi:HEAT repeat protein